ncbi:TrkA family potassium uptake protein [Corynebacterium sp. MC-21]|uniref:potassium channel family protein n=1 Tax=Corynebacterium parakroppenstedtii TaxID=2828363 RepID=UPI001EEF973A|nr:TrkA family potassium uptake protein [Corynebacterium parakroppenstedtii]MCF6778072.1 TrkA family potassium uptake protein [Corynebacterium parakroppenstedtii]MCF6788930.1 TrkA family potassium uptake protein [Corynebacterium parakroppenstedtii]MDU3197814.1 TrkA family potassium uptake protein [Corynebacterium kroppenstedtii]
MVHFFSSTTRPKMNLAPVVIVGLGRFGSAMARELTDHGVEVMGIDSRQRMVQNAADIVTNTAVADSTDIEALRQLGVDQVGRAVVAIGSNLEASILTASNLMELGVKDVWAKADSKAHGRILTQLGVHHVVRPEADTGRRVAHMLGGHIQEFVQFNKGYSMIMTKPNKVLLRDPLDNRRLWEDYKVHVVSVRSDGGQWVPATDGRDFEPTDALILAGSPERIETFARK